MGSFNVKVKEDPKEFVQKRYYVSLLNISLIKNVSFLFTGCVSVSRHFRFH